MNMKHNFIIDFLSYSEDDNLKQSLDNNKIIENLESNLSFVADNVPSISNNTYSINTNYASKIDKFMISSKNSLNSFNNSSRLSFSSNISNINMHKKNINTVWIDNNKKNPFDPIQFPFYRRYVVRYTKFRMNTKNKIIIKRNKNMFKNNLLSN